jgi:putative tricarboxylic transport membrane protein
MAAEPRGSRPGPRFAVSELVIGVALLALAAVIAFDARRLPVGALYGVGPAAPAMIVAAGLAAIGIATLVAAWRSGPTRAPAVDAGPVLTIVFGLVVLIAIVALGGGFVIGFAVLFAATARAFGSGAPHWDIGIGFVLSAAIYFGFTKLLALSLPQGPLERLF